MKTPLKTSIMDKIRILRSSRRKTNSKKGKPPPAIEAPTPTPQPAVSQATQQWVPVLVLDISRAKSAPVTANVPVTNSIQVANSNPVTKNISLMKSILVSKSIPVSSSTLVTDSIPVMTKSVALTSSIPEANQIKINASEPPGDPITHSLVGITGGTEVPEPCDKGDVNRSGKPVKCVLCDKSFPSLEDMQAHYLGTHKARRGRDSRKRKTTVENTGIPTLPNLNIQPVTVDQEKDEPVLPVSEKGEIDPKCPVCCISFKTADEVKAHVKEVHAYICSECSSTFYTLFQFTNHKCNKGTKKVKRIRKKVNNNPLLKPEVAKAMNKFVQIQPKSKRRSKNSSVEKTQSHCSPPPLQRIENAAPIITVGVDSCVVKEEFSKTVTGPLVTTCVAPALAGQDDVASTEENIHANEVERVEQGNCEEDSYVIPSITKTYTLKVPSNGHDDRNEFSNIQVIETSNIQEAKQLVKETKVIETEVSKIQVIREKIEQLKKNPNVSVSWMPTFRIKKHDDGDFVCGRCNVICDDMEDYMDHIQDCLTITSVTLEPISHPPQRLLRLKYEPSSFGCRETNNNRYKINQNLISKLQAILPQTKENDPLGSYETKIPLLENMGMVPANCTAQTFRDLLDDDFGYESHESNDVHTVGSASPVSPTAKQRDSSSSVPPIKSLQGSQTVPNKLGVVQSKVFVGNTKGAQPMVIIPVDSKAKINLISDQLLKKPGRCETAENVREVVTSQSDLASQPFTSPSTLSMVASPLDMLLSQDEIKMEVEEEVVEDHFEVRPSASLYIG